VKSIALGLCLVSTLVLACGETNTTRLGPGAACLRTAQCDTTMGLACVAGVCTTDLGALAEAGTVPMLGMDSGMVAMDGGMMGTDGGMMMGTDGGMMMGTDGGPPPMMDGGPPPMMDGGPPPVMDSGPPPVVDSGM
jgi:hypothetical protein